jgi:hypothetical protein
MPLYNPAPAPGNTTASTAYGSEPGSPTAGNLDLYSDGLSLARYSGSAWPVWGPIWPLTPPPAVSNWTWVNQSTATATDVGGSILLTVPSNGSGWNVRYLRRAQTPGAWTLEAAFTMLAINDSNAAAGIGCADSTGTKFIFFHVRNRAYCISQLNSVSSVSGDAYVSSIYSYTPYLWFRIVDDGTTNRTYHVSANGITWHQIYSETRTTFLTADSLLAGANGFASIADLALLHWKVS